MIRFKKIYNRGYVILLFNYAVNFNIFNELVKSITKLNSCRNTRLELVNHRYDYSKTSELSCSL